MCRVHAGVHDRDLHALATERLGHTVQPHLELAPAISVVRRKPRDRLVDGAEPNDVHLAIQELRLGEIVIPVIARRGGKEGAGALPRQADERHGDLALLVRSPLLRESFAGEAHPDIGQGLVALADHPEPHLAGLDGSREAPGGEPCRAGTHEAGRGGVLERCIFFDDHLRRYHLADELRPVGVDARDVNLGRFVGDYRKRGDAAPGSQHAHDLETRELTHEGAHRCRRHGPESGSNRLATAARPDDELAFTLIQESRRRRRGDTRGLRAVLSHSRSP